ncbi:MAG: hypothetical protein Q4D30_07320 [Bacteroidales bacterium]|nr:hypothetical protein [Bacteroidales bacterium]
MQRNPRGSFSSLEEKIFLPREKKNFSSGGKKAVAIPLKASAATPFSPPHKYPLNLRINNLLKNILKVFVDFCGELWGIV